MCVLVYEHNLISFIYSYIFSNWEVFCKKGKIKNKTIIQFGVEPNIFILLYHYIAGMVKRKFLMSYLLMEKDLCDKYKGMY